MKKLYALFAAALLAAPTFAQKDVVLVSPNDGKEYKDGETMIITPNVDPEWGDVIFESPSLKNKGKADVKVTMKFAPKYSFGSFQCCLGGMCQMYPSGATYETGAEAIKAGETKSILTEWNCMDSATFEYKYGECTCTMEFYVNGEKGNSYTVKYVYQEKTNDNPLPGVVLVNPNDGKEYKDGETMIITPEIDPEWGDVIFHSPSLRNNELTDAKVTMKFTPKYSFGSFQCCLGGMCQMYPSGATYETGAEVIKAGETKDILTEWNCMSMASYEYEPGECTCTMEFYVNGAKGNTYTVKYVYEKGSGPEGIQQAAVSSQPQKAYDLQGRVASQGAKGLLIKGGKKVIR